MAILKICCLPLLISLMHVNCLVLCNLCMFADRLSIALPHLMVQCFRALWFVCYTALEQFCIIHVGQASTYCIFLYDISSCSYHDWQEPENLCQESHWPFISHAGRPKCKRMTSELLSSEYFQQTELSVWVKFQVQCEHSHCGMSIGINFIIFV